MNQRELFYRHVAQTSPAPLALDIVKAEGCTLIDSGGKKYLDLIGGISVANIGHGNPHVVNAICRQAQQYLHVMVYGEFVQSPQVQYATLLTSLLPASLNSVYFTNSGAEAVECAMKLAKRVTNRTNIIACHQSYHGSTQGALSILGDEYWRSAYRPLLPGIVHVPFNSQELLDSINSNTACVILETIQAEAGIIVPTVEWLQQVRTKCTETGTLLILDEIQAGFGRTGTLWAFEQFNIVPDVLLLGKALGGGMPLGACIADKKIMDAFTHNPVLGHITTFGGHPISCAAGYAALDVLRNEQYMEQVLRKQQLFVNTLKHPLIKSIRHNGLWLAIEFENFETNKKILDRLLANGILSDWFLFASCCMRISPPLSITESEITHACKMIIDVINSI